jgi:hypothetical protein
VFAALTSTCIVMLYVAYLCVTAPLLYRRLQGWPKNAGEQLDEAGKPVFSLGRWGLPINLVAVAYGLAMAINLAWPRAEVFNPAGTDPILQYFAIIVLAVTGIGGAIAFNVKKRTIARPSAPYPYRWSRPRRGTGRKSPLFGPERRRPSPAALWNPVSLWCNELDPCRPT